MSREHDSHCIQTCNECAETCEHCATACLQEEHVPMMADGIHLDRDCAEICWTHRFRLILRSFDPTAWVHV